jgi:hypothetical protein
MKITLNKTRTLFVFLFIKPDKFLNWFYFRINTTNQFSKFGFSIELDLLKLIRFSAFTENSEDPHQFI